MKNTKGIELVLEQINSMIVCLGASAGRAKQVAVLNMLYDNLKNKGVEEFYSYLDNKKEVFLNAEDKTLSSFYSSLSASAYFLKQEL